jgi:hypothetical protein
MRSIGMPPKSYEGADVGRTSSLADIDKFLWRRAQQGDFKPGVLDLYLKKYGILGLAGLED